MTAPERYRHIAQRLKARGYESAYLDRLEAHLSPEERHESLQVEIHRETAGTLARAGAKVDLAMLELEAIAQEIEEATGEVERAERIAAFNAARETASTALLDLRITREAIGLLDNSMLARMYPIPPRR